MEKLKSAFKYPSPIWPNANFRSKLFSPPTRDFVFLTALKLNSKRWGLNKTAKDYCTESQSTPNIFVYCATAFSLDLSKLNTNDSSETTGIAMESSQNRVFTVSEQSMEDTTHQLSLVAENTGQLVLIYTAGPWIMMK